MSASKKDCTIYLEDGEDVDNFTDVLQSKNFRDSYTEFVNEKIKDVFELNNLDVSRVTDMYGMFTELEWFNEPIGKWNMSNVTHMSEMFSGAESFNQPIGNWNVSNVKVMDYMFHEALRFNQPIGDWDVSKV